MNLLMIAPLLDSRGNLRYFIGAQIDISGLVKDSTDLEAFRRMLDEEEGHKEKEPPKDEFQALSEMFNNTELDTVRKYGGNMHREHLEEQDEANMQHKPRLLIQDQSTYDVDRAEKPAPKPDGRLSGPYKHVSGRPFVCDDTRLTYTSTLLCAQRHPCASSLHRRPFVFQASSNHGSSIALAGATVSESLSATRFQTGRAVLRRRFAGYRTPCQTSKTITKRADPGGYTALLCSVRTDQWAYGWLSSLTRKSTLRRIVDSARHRLFLTTSAATT